MGHLTPAERKRRFAAQQAADALGDAYDELHGILEPSERDHLGQLRSALQDIAEGQR